MIPILKSNFGKGPSLLVRCVYIKLDERSSEIVTQHLAV